MTSIPAPAGSNLHPSARAQITERRTYLRPLNEEGTIFETPSQMVDRVISHQRWLWEKQLGRFLNLIEERELSELRRLIEAKNVTMSGRVKWMGGTDLVKERASAAFNCSFTTVNTPADLVDVFWLLLQGCGVGFKPLPGLLSGFASSLTQIEIIRSNRTVKGGRDDNAEHWDVATKTWTIVIGDSAKAWAKALGKIMAGKFPAVKLVLDLRELRGPGRRLRGYGWLSSGSEPLALALEKIAKIMMAAADRVLTAIEIGDIVNLLGTVLSSRRSAQIWLLDDVNPEIDAFIDVKVGMYENGNKHREQSNNSILFTKKPTRQTIVDLLSRILTGGEPGFINAVEAKRRAPDFVGGNPCAEILLPSKGFCVAENTPVITRGGLFPIVDIVGKETEVWNGKRWSKVTPYQTGENVTLFRVQANDGSYLDATANHRWQIFVKDRSDAWDDAKEREVTTLEMVELMRNEKIVIRLPEFTISHEEGSGATAQYAYTAGVFMGDGCLSTSAGVSVDLYGEKRFLNVLGTPEDMDRANARGTPFRRVRLDLDRTFAERLREDLSDVFSWSGDARRAFLAGLIDTDGSKTASGGVRIYLGSRKRADQVQLLLRSIGLRGSVNLMAMAGEETNLCERKSDIWYVQITDARTLPCQRVDVSGGHEATKKGRHQLVVSVERLPGTGASYCLTEPEFGMCVFGNMLTYQCNLVQVIWHRFNGDMPGLLRAQFLAGRANYRQTCVSMRDGVLQLGWDDNQHLLRLCGVAPLGYVSWEGLNQPEMLEQVAVAAINGANSMADDFGTPRPRRVTQVQPGGTSSKHMGLEGDEVHEGAHLALSRWIFNNMNISKGEPLVEILRAANYHIEDHPSDPTAVLVRIPVEYPASPMFTNTTLEIDGVAEEVEVNLESAVSQLERYRLLMKHYVQHNCFTGATKFLTAERGLASFDSFKNGDIVNVMTRSGDWTPATVKAFGSQKIWRVTVSRAGTTHVIETTEGHRWPVSSAQDRLKSREVWTTTSELARFIGKKNLVTVLPDLEIGLDDEFDVKHWKIVSVEETDRIEPVFCVVEPKAHEFVLEGNILTGNCSITISFEEDEIEAMADWFMENWDNYVGVSFLRRNDPTKSAKDLGFLYLPQQAVSKRMYETYVAQLLPIDLSNDKGQDLIDDLTGCGTGSGAACPVR